MSFRSSLVDNIVDFELEMPLRTKMHPRPNCLPLTDATFLDTNVVSEVFGPKPDPLLRDGLRSHPPGRYFLRNHHSGAAVWRWQHARGSARARLRSCNVAIFSDERCPNPIRSWRRQRMRNSMQDISAASRSRIGRRMDELDAQIAAIARSEALMVATREMSGF